MNVYSIEFCGYYPVGTVAIVIEATAEDAKKLFRQQLAIEEPYLVFINKDDDALDVKFICTTADSPKVKILLNGNY